MKQRLLTFLSDNHFEHDYCYNHLACQHGLCYKYALWNYHHFYFCTACGDDNLYSYSHLEPAGHRNINYRWSDDDAGWIHSNADFDLYGRRIYTASFDGLDYDHSRSQHSDFDEYSSSTNHHSAAVHGFDYHDSRSKQFGAYINASSINGFDHDDSRREHPDFDKHASSADHHPTAIDNFDYNHARRKHFSAHIYASRFHFGPYIYASRFHSGAHIYASRFHDFDYDDPRSQHFDSDQYPRSTNDYSTAVYAFDHKHARRKHFGPHKHDSRGYWSPHNWHQRLPRLSQHPR